MKTQILLLVTLFLTFSSASYTDNSDTPDILIGNWILSSTTATSSSLCCQPTGDLTITSNENNTVTLISTSWSGSSCGTRNSSFQEVINVTGSYSFNQIKAHYNQFGSSLPIVNDASGDQISIDVLFSSQVGTSMSLTYNYYFSPDLCYTYFNKSAQVMSMFIVVLIACLNLVIA